MALLSHSGKCAKHDISAVTCYDEMFADDKVDTDIIYNLDTFLVCIDGAVTSTVTTPTPS